MNKLLFLLTFLLCVSSAFAKSPDNELKLLPHQQKVIDYLNQNPKLHGLILYHALGAGKTVTSLSYAKQQKLKPVVLVPEALKAHWLKEIAKVGLDPAQVTLLAYNNQNDLNKILTMDFSQSLVVIDEIQKFVELVRMTPSTQYLDSYWKLSKAGKVLLLTGTPVFNDAADVAFIGNLAVGQERFPFHPDEFKSKYMLVDTSKSLFRGYLTESKLMITTLPLYATFTGLVLALAGVSPWVLPVTAMAGSASLNLANEAYPISKVSFRYFDAELFAGFTNQYISYYEASEEDKKDYPSTSIHEQKIHYTNAQVDFFMDFVDGVLSKENLARLLKDYPYTYTDAMFHINSAKIQQEILARADAGREIGNMSLQGKDGFEEAAKFLAIEALMRTNKGKTAVYSSYYNNGILLFADFLKKRGYSFEILRPDAGVVEISRVLENFNLGRNKILLIHPEITEGISLIGVEQLHILEPVKNIALERQIIGRSVRYRSHAHLPVERRHVDVYLWEASVEYTMPIWPTDAGLVRDEHWRKRFREVNPNLWTNGITQLDRQYFKKDETPDYRVKYTKSQIEGDMQSFRQVSTDYSMEQPLGKVENTKSSRELTSRFAVPLLSLDYTKDRPFYLSSLSNGKQALEITKRNGLGFGVEIPHNNYLNFGFGLRASSGDAFFSYFKNEKNRAGMSADDVTIGTFDMDLGLFSRAHYEFDKLRDVSLYWKNEVDTGVYAFVPSFGLNLGLRESVGVQAYVSQHFGINAEFGFEGKVLKDTFISTQKKDSVAGKLTKEEAFKQISAMRTLHPFVSVGVFSSYY